MRGFQPAHMRVPAQKLADGGIVRGLVRRVMGIPEPTAAPAPPPTAPAASAPAPSPAPERALTQYAGMSATERRMKEAGLKDGGPVRGPGTGTSDSIKTEARPGSYIMPADSTEQLGEESLAAMGSQPGTVPVNLSNGEYQLPPEQVHAVGVEALDAIKDATHEPVGAPTARGFAPQQAEPELFFADGGHVMARGFPRRGYAAGGLVEDEQKKLNSFGDAAAAAANPAVAQVQAPPPPAPAAPPLASAPNPASAPTPGGGASGSWEAPNQTAGSSVSAAASTPSAPASAPAFGFAPQSRTEGSGWRTSSVLRGTGEDVADQWRQGEYARGAGTLVRGTLAAVPAAFADAGEDLMSVAQPAVKFGKGVLGMEDKAASPASAPASAPKPQTPASATGAAAVGQQPVATALTRQSAMAASAPAAATQPLLDGTSQIAPGVYRTGNSYSDSPDGGMRGFALGAGQVSAQNMAAADALEARGMAERAGQRALVESGGARGFAPGAGLSVIGDGDAARLAARNASVGSTVFGLPGRGDAALAAVRSLRSEREDRTDARERARDATTRDVALGNNAASLAREAMQQDGADGRTAVQEAGVNARAVAANAIQRGELNLRREAQAPQTQAAQRQEALYQRYEAAKTPEERSAIAEQIRALKGAADPNRFTVVPGGQEIDPATQQTVTRPARIFNNQTGQFVEQAGAQGQRAAMPPGMTRQVGTAGGKPVYEDANGKRFVAG